VLPELVAGDGTRRTRFEREARVLASLNHPHIAAIFGIEEHEGVAGLVLELVEGQTLASRLEAGPLPVSEALAFARQIASALHAAHAQGIVHRDLKPRNVAVTSAGVVKVLDFGLATAVDEEIGDGTILGTTPYMSPEQARGERVTAQTDVWAFGCVLFEMLSGRRAFEGPTVSETVAAILTREPAWERLPPGLPAAVDRLLRQCLVKNPSKRAASLAAVLSALESPAPARASWKIWMPIAAAVGIIVALLRPWAATDDRTGDAGPRRLALSVPGLLSPQLSAVLSPDGRQVAYVASGERGLELWIRDLSAAEPRAIAGTTNAAHPFWSPDGRSIGFLADGQVRTVAVAGGAVRTLAATGERASPSWGPDGTILFVPRVGELGRVPAHGGSVTTVPLDTGPGEQPAWPYFLPDGRHFLFFMRSPRPEARGIYAGSLDGERPSLLVQSEYKGAYAGGHLWFVRNGVLMAQPFDPNARRLSGAPVTIASDVWAAAGAGQASFSVSERGALAYVTSSVSEYSMAWFDRSGRTLEHVGRPGRYSGSPQAGPDGRRIAVAQSRDDGTHVWLLDGASDTSSRFTSGAAPHNSPVGSSDGRRLAFRSQANGMTTVSLKNADGTGSEVELYRGTGVTTLDDWSPDGRFIVFTRPGQSLSDLWLLPVEGNRPPMPFLVSRFNKTQAQVSPDGRWIAYTSYESGRDEVYVDRFPVAGDRRQVSSAGGVQPRWRRDGHELFYVAPDRRLTAVAVDTTGSLQIRSAAPLFKVPSLPQGSQAIGLATLYAVSPDGQRFLCVLPPERGDAPITLVLDWRSLLRPR
jgi:Tol biopolymer transport system component